MARDGGMAPPSNWSFEDTLPLAKTTVPFTRKGSWTLGRLYETMHEEVGEGEGEEGEEEDSMKGSGGVDDAGAEGKEKQQQQQQQQQQRQQQPRKSSSVRLENAHDALADAKALAKVWPWLVRKVELGQRRGGSETLPSIHEHYESRFKYAEELAGRGGGVERRQEHRRRQHAGGGEIRTEPQAAGKHTTGRGSHDSELELLFAAEQQHQQQHGQQHGQQRNQRRQQQGSPPALSREQLLALLSSPVTTVKGVGEKTAARLRSLGLESCGDLLSEFQGNCGSDAGLLKAFLLRNQVGHPSGVMRIVRWVVATDQSARAARS